MKVGIDNWCPHCMKWEIFDNDGNCIKCGTHIDIVSKDRTWLEEYGVELKELQDKHTVYNPIDF